MPVIALVGTAVRTERTSASRRVRDIIVHHGSACDTSDMDSYPFTEGGTRNRIPHMLINVIHRSSWRDAPLVCFTIVEHECGGLMIVGRSSPDIDGDSAKPVVQDRAASLALLLRTDEGNVHHSN